MPPKLIKVNERLHCRRSKLPLPPDAVQQLPTPLPDFLYVTTIARTAPNARTWKVRVEPGNVELTLSSRVLLDSVAPEIAPPREQNLRSRPPEQYNPFVSDPFPDEDENEDEDSLDDYDYQTPSESEEEEKQAAPSGQSASLDWRDVADNEAINEIRCQTMSDTVAHWSALSISQFGSSAIPYEAEAMDERRRKPIHYFLLSFPVDLVHGIVRRTNEQIEEKSTLPLLINTQKYLTLLGILYLMSLFPLPNRRQYWSEVTTSVIPPMRFGRFMPISHFEHFLQHISWSEPNPNDKWSAVRDWFTEFNRRRQQVILPSDRLTIDEMMSANRTNRTLTNNVPQGLPHQTKIPRKPESVGVEIRCLIDARSEIMYALELQESKEDMATKEFVQETGSAGTACIMRQCQSLFGTGRTIYGDSAFASVNTAYHLRQRGLHFMGLVKTAHREYPKKLFKSMPVAIRSGESRYKRSERDGIPLVAVAWWDKKLKMFISTAGTNARAPDHERVRYRLKPNGEYEIYKKYTQISSIPYEYFSFAQKVDVHNHRRQGILAMERALSTRSWAFRIVSTLLGVIMVDAYALYNNVGQCQALADNEKLTFRDFVLDVATALVTNTLSDGTGRVPRPPRNVPEYDADGPPTTSCSLIPLRKLLDQGDRKKKYVQLHCRICGKTASSCCRRCSTGAHIVALCGPGADRPKPCLAVHAERTNNQ